jgi:hypothetical protein
MTTVIDTAEKWDALPMGSVVKDADGWLHTKIADSSSDDSRSTYVDPDHPDRPGRFFQPWDWGTVLVSTPRDLEAELEEVGADLALVRAELTKQKRHSETLFRTLQYAKGLLDTDDQRRVDGYVDALTDLTP